MDNSANCSEIRLILQEIDQEFDVGFNPEVETYTIYHNGRFFQSVHYKDFTRKTIEDIRKTVWININGDIFADVEKANEAADKRKERSRERLSESIAKDIRKPLLKAFEGV